MYTMEDWERDRSFKAACNEEISEEVYEEFFNCMPPQRLPNTVSATCGFMTSEPYAARLVQGKESKHYATTYLAFGKRGGKYYFFGEMTPNGEVPVQHE